jgi:F like protein
MRKAKVYAEKLLRQRAKTIARTEILRASNAGQRAAWRSARDKGILPRTTLREWIATGGACAICSPLDGKTAGLDEPFDGGIDSPPAHPSCRCTTGLINTSGSAEQDDAA